MKKSIDDLMFHTRNINAANGWDTPTSFDDTMIAEKIALIHSEVSEALEAFRNDDYPNFAEELADTVIRVFDLAEGLGVDLQSAIEDKLKVNATRGFKHGGKKV